MNENEVIMLNEGVFFRLYNKQCYVCNTITKKDYIFNEAVFDILLVIKKREKVSLKQLAEELSKIYQEPVEVVYSSIQSFVEMMVNEYLLTYIDNTNGYNNDRYLTEFIQELADTKQLFSVLIELTYQCNEKCKHCYVEAEPHDRKPEMNTKEVESVLDALADANVCEITFTGGEIFCRKDVVHLIEYATEKGFLVNVFSNGTLPTIEQILCLKRCNIRSFQTSLYGSSAKVHDEITGVKGAFEKTLHTLKVFTDIGVSTCIKYTVMQQNVKDYEDMLSLAKEIGSDIQVGLSIRPTMSARTENLKYRVGYEDLQKISYGELGRFISEYETEEQIDFSKKGICNAGFSNLTIDPYGDIYICSGIPIILGNVKEDSIEQVWKHSTKLKKWQQYKLSDIPCMKNCKYARECTFCPAQAYLETGDAFSKYEEACSIAKAQYFAKEVRNNEESRTNRNKV